MKSVRIKKQLVTDLVIPRFKISLFSYRPNPRLGNQKIYPRTRQTRQYFPWGGQVPPFGGGKSDFEVCIRGFFLNLKLFPNSTEM